MNFKIGVDGGATKTECILVNPAGRVVARRLAGGCNPNVVGPDRARQILGEAMRDLLGKRTTVTSTLLCMAGSRAIWRDFAAGLKGFGQVRAVDDSLPVLELATGGEPGLVLHGGTGSFVAARTGRAEKKPFAAVHYAGGLGWRLGDPGSGYDLGRRAIVRGLLELQGWESPSGLAPLLRAHTGLKETGAITRYFYEGTGSDPRVAALAPALLGLAAEGDPAARAIVADSTSGLLELALRVSAKLFPTHPPHRLRAGLSGPILTHRAVMAVLLPRSPFVLTPVTNRPIEGVRQLLGHL